MLVHTSGVDDKVNVKFTRYSGAMTHRPSLNYLTDVEAISFIFESL